MTRIRKTLKLLPGVRLNFNKTGISASVGAKGAYATKEVLSYNDTDKPANSGGFNFWAAGAIVVGWFLTFEVDAPWWLMILGGLFLVTGILVFLMDTVANPKWLWILPVCLPGWPYTTVTPRYPGGESGCAS